MTYEEVSNWTDKHNLIANRVKIINQVLEGVHEGFVGTPCVVKYRRGCYRVLFFGVCLVEYRVYQVESVENAFLRVDAVCDSLWYMSRAGCFTETQRTIA